jgi:hypothetical protein
MYSAFMNVSFIKKMHLCCPLELCLKSAWISYKNLSNERLPCFEAWSLAAP